MTVRMTRPTFMKLIGALGFSAASAGHSFVTLNPTNIRFPFKCYKTINRLLRTTKNNNLPPSSCLKHFPVKTRYNMKSSQLYSQPRRTDPSPTTPPWHESTITRPQLVKTGNTGSREIYHLGGSQMPARRNRRYALPQAV